MTILNHIQCIISFWDEKTGKRFIDFVKSPYFNKNEVISLLAEGIVRYSKLLLQKEMDEVDFWEKIFPHESFMPYKKHRLYTKLLSLIEDFLIVHQSLQNKPYNRKVLIENYIEKQYEKLVGIEIERYMIELKKISYVNNTYLRNILELEELRLTHSWQLQRRGKHHSDIFNPLIQALDNYYYFYRLELCTYLQYIQIMQYTDTTEESENFIPKTLALIEQNPYILDSPHAKVYYYIVKMYQESVDFSLEILQVIKQFESSFEDRELLTNIFTHLRSFHIFKAQKGNEISLASINALYQASIEKGLMYNKSGYVMVSVFLNYIQFSITIDPKSNVIRSFIDKYIPRIQPNSQEDVLRIAEAIQAFDQEDYTLVHKKIRQAKMPDVIINLQVRRLEMKTYYEQHDIDSVIHTLNSFRVFLQRCDNLQAHIIQANRNFASELKRLIDIKFKDIAITKEAIARMKEMDFLVEYWWLKEKWEGH